VTGRRGVGVVVVLIGIGVLVSLAGMAIMMAFAGSEPHVAAGSVLTLKVAGDLDELPPSSVFGLAGSNRETLRSLLETIRKAKADTRITGIVLTPSSLGAPSWGKLQEVRDAIVDFRRSGKKAVAFLEYGGEREYFLATGCEHIYLLPTSPLDLSGIASYDLFLRGTLDKIGAQADFAHIGDYKTAPNQMTEKTFTPAHREMRESLNRDLFEQLIAAIAESRKRSVDEVRRLMDDGPFLPEEAVRVGLVDDLAYEDQLDAKAKLGASTAESRVSSETYRRVSPESAGLQGGPRIAVINVVGVIASGRSGYDPMNGPVAGSDTITEYIRKARSDASVKAIVLRVDSPGGSTIASDVIWRELTLTRQGNTRPIVASMSDLAASGGYYVAMAAPDIVAQPGTLTGSIGIYGGKVVLGGTYEKLGMHVEALSIGRHAEMNSPVRAFNPEERTKLEEQLQAFYEQFVEKVAASRKMKPEAVDAVAQGRVWTGRQAKGIGLVDSLGGLDRAIALAKERAKIPASQQVDLVIYPPRRTVYDLLSDSLGNMDDRAGLVGVLLGRSDVRAASTVAAPVMLFRRGEPLALMPFAEIK
jgi:protease IV